MKHITTFLLFILFSTATLSAQVNTEVYRKKQDAEKRWYFTLNSGFTLQKGNTDKFSTANDLRVDFITEQYFAFVVGSIAWGQSNGTMDTSRGFGHIRGGRQLFHESVYLELFGQVEYDRFIKMKMRDLAGMSFRVRVLDIPFGDESLFRVYMAPGMMYEYEYLDTVKIDRAEKNPRHTPRMTSYVSAELNYQEYLTFNVVSYYQPDVTNWRDFRFLTNTSISVKVFEYFSLYTTLNVRYDSNPPALRDGNLERYDIELLNGVAVSF